MSNNEKIDEKFISLLKAKIANYSQSTPTIAEEGKVISVTDGIAIVIGLNNIMLNEVVEFENGSLGIALNLEAQSVGIIILGKFHDISENSKVKRLNKVASIPVGDNLIGRIINPIGNVLDGKNKFGNTDKWMPIEKIAPGVMTRSPIDEPLETGILMIDAMFPIGKGQRELIIGDRQTGKTSIALNAILNQKGKKVKCIYVAIGQKKSTLAQLIKKLEVNKALEYTTIVASTASDHPAFLYLAPYAGVTIAEEWMSKGEDVLIIYDDLSKHAVAYRTISLLLRRPPGREAYPGDIFYLHSRLLERACKLDKKYGGGSITALPIVETLAGDISAYVPTNIISITDGQLFLQANLFNLNQRPAIDVGLSVSRVGSAAQYKAVKQVSSSLKIDLSQYYEMVSFSQFGSDLDEATLSIIENGKRINELIKQSNTYCYTWYCEVAILFLINKKIIRFVPLANIIDFKDKFLTEVVNFPVIEKIISAKKLDQALEDELLVACLKYVNGYVNTIEIYDNELSNQLIRWIDDLTKKTTDEKDKKKIASSATTNSTQNTPALVKPTTDNTKSKKKLTPTKKLTINAQKPVKTKKINFVQHLKNKITNKKKTKK